MLKFCISVALLGLFIVPRSWCDDSSVTEPALPFKVGESLEYHVHYGAIPAGKARIAILDTASVRGQLCYHAVSQARSAKAFDIFFKVRDKIETWFDFDSLYTHRYHKRQREGRYRDEKIVEYLHDKGIARLTDDGEFKGDYPVPRQIQDALSAIFWVRTLTFAEDTTLIVPVHDIRKTYDLLVVIGKKEKIKTRAGEFECYVIEPRLESGGIFKKDKGARIWIWFTADDRKIPVMMQSKVFFGRVTAELEKYIPGQEQNSESGGY